MSYANGTQFYNLPQTVGTDKRDWFDTNAAFADIDAALHAAFVGQAANAEAISTINSKLAADEADIAALQTKTTTHDNQIAALQTNVNTQASQIQDVRQDAEDMITANNEGAAATSTRAYAVGNYFIYNDVLYKATAAIAIGDTIVPNSNCEATNVDTELTQLNNDLTKSFETLKQVSGDGTVQTVTEALGSNTEFIIALNFGVNVVESQRVSAFQGMQYNYFELNSGNNAMARVNINPSNNLLTIVTTANMDTSTWVVTVYAK